MKNDTRREEIRIFGKKLELQNAYNYTDVLKYSVHERNKSNYNKENMSNKK